MDKNNTYRLTIDIPDDFGTRKKATFEIEQSRRGDRLYLMWDLLQHVINFTEFENYELVLKQDGEEL